jgi:RNA polymerase sigma-70 factor (ECF subfamily)
LKFDAHRKGELALSLDDTGRSRAVSPLEIKVADLYREHSLSLRRYLYVILRDQQLAEDLTQETFLRLFRSLSQGESIQEMRAWIFRVARNLATDALRQRRSSESLDENHMDLRTGAEEHLLESERLRKVQEALDLLSPQERACLVLRSEGLKFREIASTLEVKIPTVETALTRALKKIIRRIHG